MSRTFGPSAAWCAQALGCRCSRTRAVVGIAGLEPAVSELSAPRVYLLRHMPVGAAGVDPAGCCFTGSATEPLLARVTPTGFEPVPCTLRGCRTTVIRKGLGDRDGFRPRFRPADNRVRIHSASRPWGDGRDLNPRTTDPQSVPLNQTPAPPQWQPRDSNPALRLFRPAL